MKTFSVSSILKVMLILFASMFSLTLALTDSNCSLVVIISIFSKISSTLLSEYGSFSIFLKNFSLCFFSILLILVFFEIGLRLAGEEPRHLYDISNNEVITNDVDEELGWKPEISFDKLVESMVENDLSLWQKENQQSTSS